MSSKPCGNCKKTVYVNEKIDAEGRWYHRGCFKCMAPDCNTSLTLRNFQMAALDDSVIDPMTNRPLKVLVCKPHVPMPNHSLNADSLAFKHTTSAPKPSIPGLHRSVMGGRGNNPKDEVVGYGSPKLDSPRSLDQGSHAEILKSIASTQEKKEHKNEEEEKDTSRDTDGAEEEEPKMLSMETTTLPKSRQGRFTVSAVSDPVAEPHDEAHDSTKDDYSYKSKEKLASVEKEEEKEEKQKDEDSWDDHEDEHEDHKQPRIFTTKSDTTSKTKTTSDIVELENSLGSMAIGSKLMDSKKHGRSESKDTVADNDTAVDDDEWDNTPADDASRREAIAGI